MIAYNFNLQHFITVYELQQQVYIHDYLRGSFFSATVDCIVFTKHVLQTAIWVHGKVCIVALLAVQIIHCSSGQDGGSSWTSSSFSTSESYER